ncbi:MAG: ExbD/TolR family protein [Pirellulales bacterium]
MDDGTLVKTRRPRPIPNQLDITPMIDVTFLLLVFFLVTSTSNAEFVARLPQERHGMALSESTSTILTVARSGRQTAPVYIGNGKIASNELSADADEQARQIEQQVREGVAEGKRDVLIKADKDVAYREVARVAAAAARVPEIELHFAVLESD